MAALTSEGRRGFSTIDTPRRRCGRCVLCDIRTLPSSRSDSLSDCTAAIISVDGSSCKAPSEAGSRDGGGSMHAAGRTNVLSPDVLCTQ